ncbi:hypothetical protein EAF04_009358 [Stromatinia cepivora]|nr:hypothetical protein EAF04_009358 [Stromatinia cepivora]
MRQAKSNLVRRDSRKDTNKNSIKSSPIREATPSPPSPNLKHQAPSPLNTANKIPIHIRHNQDPSRDHKEYLITFRRQESSNTPLAELQSPDFNFQRLKDTLKDPNESRVRFNPNTERLIAYIPIIKGPDDMKSVFELIEVEFSSDFRRVIQAALNGDLSVIDLIVQSKDSPLPPTNTTSQAASQHSLSDSVKANTGSPNLADYNSESVLDNRKSSDEEEDSDIISPTEKIQAKRLVNRQKKKRDRDRSVPCDTDNENNNSFKSADGSHKPASVPNNDHLTSHLGSPASPRESTSHRGAAVHFQDKLLDAFDEEKEPEQEEGESKNDFEERLRLWKEARADIASMKLQAQLESKICEQLDEEKWSITCDILHHPRHIRKSDFIVQIHGMKCRLLPYQAHNVIRTLMIWNSDVGSTFQAHEMGLGKTLMSYTTCYLQHAINCMWDDIQQKPADHLSSDQMEGQICPSNHRIYKQYGLDCPCTKAHETSKFKPSLGIHVILVPLGLLTNWIDEWHKFFDENNPLNMQLVVAHGNAKGDMSVMNSSAKSDMMSDVDLGDPHDPSKPVCTPKLQNSRIICITTSHSISKQLFERFEKEKVVPIQNSPYASRKRNPDRTVIMITPKLIYQRIKYTKLTISTLWRDEAHKEHLATSATLQVLKNPFFEEKRHENIHYNPMSGTLITSGPMDVAEYLIRMKRPSWDNHKALKSFDSTKVLALGKMWDKKVKDGVLDEEVSQKCIDLLLPIIEAITLRFTAKSNFLGEGPIVLLPPNIYSEISCQHEPKWQERLQIQK